MKAARAMLVVVAAFAGTFHDSFRWPARALNVPLTFRAVVTTPLGTRRLDYSVRVRR